MACGPALAQAYPQQPIKLVVPFVPGSPVDVLARTVTVPLSTRLGQSVIIENRPWRRHVDRHAGRRRRRAGWLYAADVGPDARLSRTVFS